MESSKRYTQSHEWIKVDGQAAMIGITDHAQKEVGDIVYVELPLVGKIVKAGQEVVVLESTKAAIDLYSPLSGKIVAVNEALRENPQKINQSAEKEGWLFRMTIENPKEYEGFMTESSYLSYMKEI